MMRDRSTFAQVFWALVLFFFGLPFLLVAGVVAFANLADLLADPGLVVLGLATIGAILLVCWLIERYEWPWLSQRRGR